MNIKKLARDEKGQALVVVLILLVISGLIIAPLLSYLGTGVITGNVYVSRTDELYAADAGVEDALWRIESKDINICPGKTTQSYDMSGLNDRSVDAVGVVIRYLDGPSRYKITSVATTYDGSSTTVESYVDVAFRFVSFLDNAITSKGDVRIYDAVNGTVQYGGHIFGEENINGERPIHEVYPKWPSMDALRSYYDVTNLPTLAPDDANKELIDIENHATIGGRRDGNLNIDNTGGHRTLTLNGTLYVTGSLTFNGVGTPDYYTIDLNKNTILVGGAITFPSNGVSITGSGCIIAEKSIKFLPGTESSPDDFVLLLSLTEDVTLLPSSGTFYGSIAGPSVESDVSTKVDIVWQPLSEGGIDFPIDMYGYDIVDTATVRTWEVKRE